MKYETTLVPTDIPDLYVSGIMMFATRTIDGSIKRLMVEHFHDDGDLDVITTDGIKLRVNRFQVITPIGVCIACGKGMVVNTLPRGKGEYAECPDHARHMYESYYAAAHDIRKYNHTKRRELDRQARHWLNVWMKEFARRNKGVETE